MELVEFIASLIRNMMSIIYGLPPLLWKVLLNAFIYFFIYSLIIVSSPKFLKNLKYFLVSLKLGIFCVFFLFIFFQLQGSFLVKLRYGLSVSILFIVLEKTLQLKIWKLTFKKIQVYLEKTFSYFSKESYFIGNTSSIVQAIVATIIAYYSLQIGWKANQYLEKQTALTERQTLATENQSLPKFSSQMRFDKKTKTITIESENTNLTAKTFYPDLSIYIEIINEQNRTKVYNLNEYNSFNFTNKISYKPLMTTLTPNKFLYKNIIESIDKKVEKFFREKRIVTVELTFLVEITSVDFFDKQNNDCIVIKSHIFTTESSESKFPDPELNSCDGYFFNKTNPKGRRQLIGKMGIDSWSWKKLLATFN